MICPAVGTTHNLCHSDILSISFRSPHYEIVYENLVFASRIGDASRMTCFGLVDGRLYWLSADHVQHILRSRKPLQLHLPTTSEPYRSSQCLVVCTNSSIEVTKKDGACRHHQCLYTYNCQPRRGESSVMT